MIRAHEELTNVVEKCWAVDRSKRPDALQTRKVFEPICNNGKGEMYVLPCVSIIVKCLMTFVSIEQSLHQT